MIIPINTVCQELFSDNWLLAAGHWRLVRNEKPATSSK
jgi:hypothetical protein